MEGTWAAAPRAVGILLTPGAAPLCIPYALQPLNFVFRSYDESKDGSKRMRVRFNVKGPKGHCMVWAEVSCNLAILLLNLINFFLAGFK